MEDCQEERRIGALWIEVKACANVGVHNYYNHSISSCGISVAYSLNIKVVQLEARGKRAMCPFQYLPCHSQSDDNWHWKG